MRIIGLLIAAYIIAALILFIYAEKSFKKGGSLGKNLGFTFIFCALTLMAFGGNFFSGTESVMKVMLSIEKIVNGWTVFFMTLFMVELEGNRPVKKLRLVAAMLMLADTVILLTNFFNNYSFDYSVINGKYISYMHLEPKPLYAIHSSFLIIMLVVITVSMISKVLSSPSYYKLRYGMVIGSIIAIVAANTFFELSSEFVYDISRLLYGVAALLFYHATYEYHPYGLIREIQTYVNDNMNDAVIMYDIFGDAIKTNEKANVLFAKEVYQKKDALLEYINYEPKAGKTVVTIEDGIFEVLYNPIYENNSNVIASVFILYDITEKERQLEREHKAAIMDSLTGCYNRTGFLEKATDFLTKTSYKGSFAVLIGGILNFKGINGLYGTRNGDKVLIEIARRLKEYSNDFPMLYGRTAEGKFTCLMPFEMVDRLINENSRIVVPLDDDYEIHVDMCYGFVVVSDLTKSIDHYCELAVLALAKCKSQMSVSAVEYANDMAQEQLRKQKLLSAMHDAIENHEFYIELQPQINLEKNKVTGAEALVRWEHPTLGRVSPAEFIPIFENNGFITKLDRYVWNEAAATLSRLSEAGLYYGTISVNVSQIDIMCMDVAKEFEEIVERHSIPPEKLHIEITESACANNRDILISTLTRLREKGFIIEIDDFGTGYSSLNALVHIPFDVVKLDMLFMLESVGDNKGDVIMSAICKMIHELNAEIIVEGVETTENLETTIHLNADMAQGYYYSKPLQKEIFVDFVRTYS